MTSEAAGLTPAAFHREKGVEDWRATAWSTQACYRADSLAHGAALIDHILTAADQHALSPDIDLHPEAINVRVLHLDDGRIPANTAAFAATVSAKAVGLGLRADPSLVQSVGIAVAQHTSVDTRPFWMAALGYDDIGDEDAGDPLCRGPYLAFHPWLDRTGRGRTHIDVSVPADQAEARVAAALAAGGRLVDDTRAPQWWTIASPDNHGIDIAAWTDSHD